jgi:SAM-dependent methyltransferase
MQSRDGEEYLLGANEAELERLRFQHSVWAGVTNALFDRLKVAPGWRCLDVGAGPGFVAEDLRTRVGERGEMMLLEPSGFFLQRFEQERERRHWKNVVSVRGTAEEARLPEKHFDLIFARWVIAFVPDPGRFLRNLVRSLRPGGIIALQDYWYEGLSLYPRGGAFERVPEVVRSYYRSAGGDVYVTGTARSLFRQLRLDIVDFKTNQLCGGPESPAAEWMHRFFVPHLPLMAEKGLVSQKDCDDMLADWHQHRANPDALFFTPLVVDLAGKLPD